jgi:hypothetical protein
VVVVESERNSISLCNSLPAVSLDLEESRNFSFLPNSVAYVINPSEAERTTHSFLESVRNSICY